MSATRLPLDVLAWIEDDRINLGFKGEGLPPSVRLSTRLHSHVGKALADQLHTAQLRELVEKLGSSLSRKVATVDGGLQIDFPHDASALIAEREGELVVTIDTDDHPILISQLLTLAQIAMQAQSSISRWSQLTLASGPDELFDDIIYVMSQGAGNGHARLVFGQENVAWLYPAHDRQQTALLDLSNASEDSTRLALRGLHEMRSQRTVPLLVNGGGRSLHKIAEVLKRQEDSVVVLQMGQHQGGEEVAILQTASGELRARLRRERSGSTSHDVPSTLIRLDNFTRLSGGVHLQPTWEQMALLESAVRRASGCMTSITPDPLSADEVVDMAMEAAINDVLSHQGTGFDPLAREEAIEAAKEAALRVLRSKGALD